MKNQFQNNNQYPNLLLLIKIYCFKEDIINKSKENNPQQVTDILFIKKSLLDKYKNLLGFKDFISYLKKHPNILDPIKENKKINYSKLTDSVLSKIIITNIKNNLIKIENKKIYEINNEINKEFQNVWDYKIIEYNEPKEKKLRLINDIEIINTEIVTLLNNPNMNLNNIMTGKCILGSGKIIIYMADYKQHIFFEIGTFNNGDIKIEYLLDINELKSSQCINDYFGKIEIKKLIKNFDKNKEINSIIIENKENKVLNFYKVDEKKVISGYSNKFNNKLKSLVLLSIYQNVLFQNQNKEEKVFFLNKNYFDKYFYKELNALVKIKVQNTNNDTNITNIKKLTNHFIDIIIFQLDGKELKEINKKIPKIHNNSVPHTPKEEEIKLMKTKLIDIYTDFIIINEEIFNKFFVNEFNIKFENKYIYPNSFITINNKDIIKINNQFQSTIFIGNYNYQNYTYKIEKILDYKINNQLESEYDYLKKCGIEFYCGEKLILNKSSKNEDLVSPIFSNDSIIGYSYDYNSNIKDYSNLNKYLQYYDDKILIANLSLCLFYFQIEEKLKIGNKTNSQKYYLINRKTLTQIRIDSEFKLLKEDIFNKIDLNIICNDNNNNKNLYSLLKICPLNLLKKYSNKIIKTKKDELAPEIISKQYYDNNANMNNAVMIYDNFEIIDKKIIKLFTGKTYLNDDNLLADCYFNNGYIIINLPNFLNNQNFISLLGILDCDKDIKIEYILVYNDDNNRNIHIQSISNNLDSYVNKLNKSKKCSPIIIDNNSQIIGTIINNNPNIESVDKDVNNIVNNNIVNNNIDNNNIINNNNIVTNNINFNNNNNFIIKNNFNNNNFNNNFINNNNFNSNFINNMNYNNTVNLAHNFINDNRI